MSAFVNPIPVSARHAGIRIALSPRRPSPRPYPILPRCCAAAAPSTTYTESLQTDAQDIEHSSTDALIIEVNDMLSARALLPQQLIERMVVHLADNRGMARLGLVEAFGTIGSPALPALLAGLTSCPNPVVRRSCGKALAKIGDSAATEPLLTTLVNDEDTVTRSSSAGALARMGRVAVPHLLKLISDPSISMTAKGHAAWAISFMQGDAGDALFDSVHHPSQDVRIAVISALGAVAIGDALPAMGTSSDDDWGEDDCEKAGLRDRAISVMRTALNDGSPEVRAEAATALANAGCTEEAGKIADMLTDQDVELRRTAALALMKLGDVSVVERLSERADDETEVDSVRNVARLAASYLKQMVEEDSDWE